VLRRGGCWPRTEPAVHLAYSLLLDIQPRILEDIFVTPLQNLFEKAYNQAMSGQATKTSGAEAVTEVSVWATTVAENMRLWSLVLNEKR
jgi:hypothetical protein